MKDSELRVAAKKFVEEWGTRGDEKSDTQTFWMTLLHDVFGVKDPASFIQFEKRVKVKNVNFIDAYIKKTRVLIEQKSADVNPRKATRQSDGESLTPFQQAYQYNNWLPFDERSRSFPNV